MIILELYLILFLVAFTLHNVEEFIWLPKWFKQYKSLERKEFGVSVIFVTLLSYIAVFLYLSHPSNPYFTFIVVGFLGGMILNVFLPHALESIRTKSYMPGLATGVFFLLPANGYALYKFINSGVSIFHVCIASLIVGISLILIILLIFKVGRVFLNSNTSDSDDIPIK